MSAFAVGRRAVAAWRLPIVLLVLAVAGLTLALAAGAEEKRDDLSVYEPGGPKPPGFDPALGPLAGGRGLEQLRAAWEKQKELDEARKKELASPELRAARSRSESEFVGLGDGAARMLLESEFGADLGGSAVPDLDDVVDGRRIEKFVGDRAVLLAGEGDRPPALVETPRVALVEGEDGRKRPVDLSLESTAGGFSPVGAAAEVRIASSLEEGVAVGPVTVVPAGVADGQVAGVGRDQVIYANAQVDTDVAVKTATSGVEVFWQLRSPRAPEELTLDLELPDGAVVQAAGQGSAAVVLDDKRITSVSAPVAVDAQGEDVPVVMEVIGERLVVSIAHRDRDVAYPLLVDPVVEDWYGLAENGGNGQQTWFHGYPDGLQHWFNTYGGVPVNTYAPRYNCYIPVNCYNPGGTDQYNDGLHFYVRPYYYPAGSAAQWLYQPPGTTTRIDRMDFGVKYLRMGSGSPASPVMFNGIWRVGGAWVSSASFNSNFSNHWNAHFAGSQPGPQQAVFGFYAPTAVNLTGWRDGYMGSAIIYLTDLEPPTVGGPGLMRHEFNPAEDKMEWNARAASQWVKQGDALALRPAIADTGLGVKKIQVDGGYGIHDESDEYCIGGKSYPCHANWPATEQDQLKFSVPTAMPEGENSLTLHAWDALARAGANSFSIKVDNQTPVIDTDTLSGSLWENRELDHLAPEEQPVLSPGSHSISVSATDPFPSGQVRSGVEKLEFRVDGQPVHTEHVPCPAGNCPLSLNWSYDTVEFGGRHKVELVATDGAGNQDRETFYVNSAATGDLVYPADGEITSSKIALQAKDNGEDFTGVKFQYRRRPLGLWTTISGNVTDDQGVPITGDTHALIEPDRHTKKLIWDVRTVLGALVPKATQIQVRAIFTGGPQEFKSRVSDVDLDAKGLSADNAQESIGPGSVDLLTGNFSYSATDASLSTFAGPIEITRTFNSLDPGVNPDGPYGPGWVVSAPMGGVSDYSSLVVLTDPSTRDWVDVFDSAGQRIRFEKTGETTFRPQVGFEALTLTRTPGTGGQTDQYTLVDLDGVETTFVLLPTTSKFVPSRVKQPDEQGTASYNYEAYLGEPRLKRVVAPPPPNTDCDKSNLPATSLPVGCRVLELSYGAVPGVSAQRLTSISQVASNGSQMTAVPVASFAYKAAGDHIGQLAEAWDPRISPALKEAYDYTGAYHRIALIAPPGEAAWTLGYLADATGTWRLDSVSRTATESGLEKWRMRYQVPLSTAAGGPYEMTADPLKAWGQADRPIDATAILPPTETGSGYSKASVLYLNQDGRVVNSAAPGGRISVAEYDPRGNVIRELSAANRARAALYPGNTQAKADYSKTIDTQRTYSVNGLRLVDEVGPEHEVKLDSGDVVNARAHTVTDYDQGSTLPANKAPHLPTTVTTGAQVEGSEPDEDIRVVKTAYNWTLRKPTKTTIDAVSGGLNIENETHYNDAGLETASRQPKSNGSDAGTTKTIYYGDSTDGDCDDHIEWFNLPCKTLPAAQPGTAGLPDLPVTTYAYNRFGQVTTATETIGAVSRTTTTSYDPAGRQSSTAISTNDAPTGGLVGAWGFEEASGSSVLDSSNVGNHGTIENASRSGEGRFGKSVRFDGAGDLVRVPDSPSLDVTGPMTLEAWARLDPMWGMAIPEIVGKAGTGTSCSTMYSLSLVTGYMSDPFAYGRRCSAYAYQMSSPARQGAWNHLALTVDSGNVVRLYVDGEQVASTTMSASTATNAADLLMGSDFVGLVDEVRVYDRKLSEGEIAQDMRAPVDPDAVDQVAAPAPQSGLVGAFGFEDEPSSGVLVDSSGNGNDGELSSATQAAGGRHGDAITTSDGMAVVPDYGGELSMTGPMTIDAWVGLEHGYDPYSDPTGVIAGKADTYALRINSDGDAEFAIDPSGSGTFLPEYTVVATGSEVLDSDRMVHVTGTYDGTTLRIYLDGNLAGEVEVDSGPSSGSEPFTIGGSSYESPLAATVDEVRVYDRELSPTEIAQDAATPVALPIAGDPVINQPRSPGSHPVPPTTYGYSSTTGRPTTVSADGKTTTTTYDNAGRVIGYTDRSGPDGTTSTIHYDNLNRPTTTNDGKGTQTRTYDTTTGSVASVTDAQNGLQSLQFTASYDADGRMVSKTYPNGMKADTTYDPSGAPVALKYTKTSNCSSNCVWIDEQVKESIHGQWRTHSWELSSQEYTYDKAGRLTRVEDDVQSPTAVAGCTIRSYSFDANSNRTAMNTKAPAGNSDCQPGAAGTSKTYTYDDADRLTGTGIQYDQFGRMTSVPAQHSGGGVLTYTYYANEQVRTISQDGVSKTYALDPAGRQRQTIATGGTTYTETFHYKGGSDSPSWTSVANGQGLETSWERNITGIDGDLAAIRTHSAQADTTVLQLTNLHGDIIATASTDPNATALASRFDADEFGNPRQSGGADQRYGWLGGKQRRSELSSGVIQMGVRSYIPALGRFTSIDPVAGGSATDYDYANADPVNQFDLDGRVTGCKAFIKHLSSKRKGKFKFHVKWNCPASAWPGNVHVFKIRVTVEREVRGTLETIVRGHFKPVWSHTYKGKVLDGRHRNWGLKTTEDCDPGYEYQVKIEVTAKLQQPTGWGGGEKNVYEVAKGITRCKE